MTHLKNKSNLPTLQSQWCLLQHASSHEKLIFWHIKKWLNIKFPKPKENELNRDCSHWVKPLLRSLLYMCFSRRTSKLANRHGSFWFFSSSLTQLILMWVDQFVNISHIHNFLFSETFYTTSWDIFIKQIKKWELKG